MPLGGQAGRRSCAIGNDWKGAGVRAGYWVLKKVFEQLRLLISSPTQTNCPVLPLLASSSAAASSQDCPWVPAGKVKQQGGGQAQEGVTLGVRGPAGCLGINRVIVLLYHLIN